MKRRLTCFAMFLPLLACLMAPDTGGLPGGELAASSIAFDAGQPAPNPGGVAQMLEGKGTFAVDPAETFAAINFRAKDTKGTKQTYLVVAATNQAKWSGTLMVFASNYDSSAQLFTKDKAGMTLAYNTGIVNVNVK